MEKPDTYFSSGSVLKEEGIEGTKTEILLNKMLRDGEFIRKLRRSERKQKASVFVKPEPQKRRGVANADI